MENQMRADRYDEAGCQRRSIAASLGLGHDDPVVDDLHAAGFRLSTISLLELLPLVELAWSDGSVSPREAQSIAAAAARRPAIRGSAHSQLRDWLTTRPSEDLFHVSRRAIRRLLDGIGEPAAAIARDNLLIESTLLLRPVEGLLGGDALVGADHRRWLDGLAADLGAKSKAMSVGAMA